jgi:hypothetical protein
MLSATEARDKAKINYEANSEEYFRDLKNRITQAVSRGEFCCKLLIPKGFNMDPFMKDMVDAGYKCDYQPCTEFRDK